jgi:membrane fusion protein, multidrug efflux system
MQLRAEFRNPHHTLLPGQFVRVGLVGIKREGVILVPQRAIQQGLGGAFVYVVDSANGVSQRNVVASAWNGQQWVVDRGLKAGDRVVVDGVQKIVPGAPVKPVAYVPPPDTLADGRTDTIRIAPPGEPLKITPSR